MASDSPREPSPTFVLLAVSTSVLLVASTWLSGTAVAESLSLAWNLGDGERAALTTSVQLGFIVGTFLYAATSLADVFSATRVFVVSSIFAGIFNALFAWQSSGLWTGMGFRFATGLTLAGVYPVGMKILASWFKEGLGWRLGIMVAALVAGTASPYLVQALTTGTDWRLVVSVASVSAWFGAALVFFWVADGPHLRTRATFDARMMFRVFGNRHFRYTAAGYFGHMWELYAYWSFVSLFVAESFAHHGIQSPARVSFYAFATIAIGALGCALGGWWSRRVGERRVATLSLAISALCCLLSGWLFLCSPLWLFLFLAIWGFFVVSDSPQFSALAARYAPARYTGTALTVQNGIGFGITVLSLQLLPLLSAGRGWRWILTILAIGPLCGLYAMRRLRALERYPSESDDLEISDLEREGSENSPSSPDRPCGGNVSSER